MQRIDHEKWMRIALEEAEKALGEGELPIGGVLTSRDLVLATTQTSVKRRGSICAHGELIVLLETGDQKLFSADRPVHLYTTLEPCLMCLGAAMQCRVDNVIYGMRCAPDGGVALVETIQSIGQDVPSIVSGVLENECVDVFSRWPHGPEHPAYGYVRAILSPYSR